MELTGSYRHELKYQINPADHHVLRQRLRTVMKCDPHTGADGLYTIRSVYFDNYGDKAAAPSPRAGVLCAGAVHLRCRKCPRDLRFPYPNEPVPKRVFRWRDLGYLCDRCPWRCDLRGKIRRLSAGDHPQFASIRRTPPAGVLKIRFLPPVRLIIFQ